MLLLGGSFLGTGGLAEMHRELLLCLLAVQRTRAEKLLRIARPSMVSGFYSHGDRTRLELATNRGGQCGDLQGRGVLRHSRTNACLAQHSHGDVAKGMTKVGIEPTNNGGVGDLKPSQ